MTNEAREGSLESPRTAGWLGASAAMAGLASACCLAPVVLAALGISAAGISGALEPLRPIFLVLTAALLGVGFYLTYFRRHACRPGADCATPDPKRVRRGRAFLWTATAAIALVALFPVYGGALLRAGAPGDAAAGSAQADAIRLRIEGMTCDACAANIEKSLRSVPGVVAASVDVDTGEAVVRTSAGGRPTSAELIAAVEKAGAYRATVAARGGEGAR